MNNNELENIWNSPANRPEPAAVTAQMEQYLKRLRGRHRGFVIITSLAGLWLAVILIRLGYFVAGGGALRLSQEWGAVGMLLLPLTVLIVFAVQFRRHCRVNAEPERSIHTSLLALLDENRLARLRLKIIAGLYAAVMLIIPLVVHQLRAAGKAGDEILVPAFVLLPLLLLALLCGLIFHYRTRLLPRHRELKELLAAYP
ncbi:MAG: hypothetical protein V4726_19995 [Verrucomicrobiota bacterium]